MAWKLGDRLVDRIDVLLPDGTGAEGLTFTVDHVLAIAPDHSIIPFSRIEIEELGEGAYEVALQTYTGADDTEGTYSIHIKRPDGWPQTFTVEWDVDPKLLLPPGGISRATLRRMVLARFGDLQVVTATETGTTTTLRDTNAITLGPGMYKGREIIFTGGQSDLRGLVRHIDASSRDLHEIHFSNALPVATAVGDEGEMVNSYGVGVTIEAVHHAINYAIGVAQDYALVPVAYDLTDLFDGDSAHRFTIPDEFVGIEDVLMLNDSGEWVPVQRAGSAGSFGWFPEFSQQAVAINGHVGTLAHDRYLRVSGYMLPEELTTDTDETTIDREWLINTATAHLALNIAHSRQASGEWYQKGTMYQSRADAMLSRLTPNIGPSFQRFR